MTYGKSISGGSLCALIQIVQFSLPGLVPNELLRLWSDIGRLCALVWMPMIQNFLQYLADIDVATRHGLNGFAMRDPRKIIDMVKLHLLTHLDEDIERFGRLVGVAT